MAVPPKLTFREWSILVDMPNGLAVIQTYRTMRRMAREIALRRRGLAGYVWDAKQPPRALTRTPPAS